MSAVYECIPNISEGRRPEIIERFAEAVRSVSGARLLDYSADWDHNRSVFTCIGEAESLQEVVFRLTETASSFLDMHEHHGVHPRIGAVDVVPFVPLQSASMAEAVALTVQIASAVAERFSLPIYLYGQAARCPQRAALSYLRRGGWEALNIEGLDSEERRPDIGPKHLHPRLGASCFGARGPLIAFNVWLKSQDLAAAKHIASAIRASSGGLPYVQALGLELPSQGAVQISMNLTNPQVTSLDTVFNLVKAKAEQWGIEVLKSELIGCLPLQSLCTSAAHYLQLEGLSPQRVVENGLINKTIDRV
ncbi:MAG: glutamate formimidoyltransferase [Candidatus Bruticola sp.]